MKHPDDPKRGLACLISFFSFPSRTTKTGGCDHLTLAYDTIVEKERERGEGEGPHEDPPELTRQAQTTKCRVMEHFGALYRRIWNMEHQPPSPPPPSFGTTHLCTEYGYHVSGREREAFSSVCVPNVFPVRE